MIHRSQFMGEMGLLCLTCLLFLLNPSAPVLQFTLIHLFHLSFTSSSFLHIPFFSQLSPFHLLLPPRPQRLRRPRDEWLPEQWAVPDRYKQPREPTPAVASSDDDSDDSDDPLDLIQAGAASALSPHPTGSPSNALMQICGRRLVRKRWRLTESMALGRLSNCLLGSVQLAPDGS
jgi:hypothetical protein